MINMYSDTIIILPTYNEAENIGILLERLINLPCKYDILVIDDESRDGTIDIVRDFMSRYDNIDLIVRHGVRGLGTALLRGYNEAVKRGYNYIVQMDADLQHPPELIPDLVKRLSEGCDVVIASRYVEGGSVEGWNIYRRVVSRFANKYAKTVLGLRVRDITSGFRAFKREVLEYLVNKEFKSSGFIIQVETLYYLFKGGFSICEYPFKFVARARGKSKLSMKIILEYFIKVPLIRLYT